MTTMEKYRVVKDTKCETLFDLYDFLLKTRLADNRNSEAADATAVHIDNKHIHIELREFENGTREYALKGM